jgi:hypothetical protein
MTKPTTPTYVRAAVGWPSDTSEHPIVSWFVEYSALFDDKTFERSGGAAGKMAAYHTSTFVYRQGGKPAYPPGTASVERIIDQYRILEGHCHEPVHLVVHPATDKGNEGGYEFLVKANLYVNVAATVQQDQAQIDGSGQGRNGQTVQKARSADGREWDLVVPTMAHMVFVADPEGPNGFRMSYVFVSADELQLSELLVRKGLATWDQVGAETGRFPAQGESFVGPAPVKA